MRMSDPHHRADALLARNINKTVGMFYFQAYDSVNGQWCVRDEM